MGDGRKTAAVLFIFVFLSSVFPVAASGQGRDVAVANVLIDPSEPQPGDVVTTGVTVANLGNASLKEVPVTLCVNGSQVGSTQYVDLEAGSAIVVQFEWSPQSYGSYTIVGAAGPVNGESDETNNQATTTLTISEPVSVTDNQTPDTSVSEPAPTAVEDSGAEAPAPQSSVPTPALTTSWLAESAAAAAKTIEAGKQSTAHRTVEVEVQGTDVSAKDLVLTPRNPSPGDAVAVRMTVANTGTAPLDDIPVKLLVDGTQVGETQYVDNLPRGETVTVEFEWVPENFGSYSLVGVAGPLDGEQRNPLNNFASAVVSISSVTVIPEQSITTSKLADAAVTAAKLALDPASLYRVSGGILSITHASPEGLRVTGPLQVTEEIPGSPVILRPNGAGYYTQFDVLVGAPTHWEAENEIVADDAATYVGSDLNGVTDTFGLENIVVPASSITIDNVVVHVRARGRAGNNKDWQVMIRSGGIDAISATIGSTGWAGYSSADYSGVWTTDPSTNAPWTVEAINALEAGAQTVTGVDITQVYVEVSFTPAPQYSLTTYATPDNYYINFSQNHNFYLNWANVTRVTLASDGSIVLDNSIYFSGGIFQDNIRGIPENNIRDNAITENKIAENAITNRQIRDNFITGNKIADATIAAAKLDFNVSKFLNIADNDGNIQFFAVNENDNLRIAGSGLAQIRFDAENRRVIIYVENRGTASVVAENGLENGPGPDENWHIGIAENGVTPGMLAENSESLYRVTGGAAWVENRLNVPGWWDGNWSRRRTITITAGSASPAGYQENIPLLYDSDMAFDNFQDSRFVWENSTGQYLLPYWFESVSSGVGAKVWVKLPPALSAGQSCDNLKWYYGNPSAAPAENGSSVFTLFDNFDGTTIDSSKWKRVGPVGYITQNGRIIVTADSWTTGLYSYENYFRPFVYEFKWTPHMFGPGDYGGLGIKNTGSGVYGPDDFIYWVEALNGYFDYYHKGVRPADGSGLGSFSADTNYYWRFEVLSTGCRVYYGTDPNNLTLLYNDGSYNDSPVKVGLNNHSQQFYLDDARVRKYAAQMPTVSFGAEEDLDTAAETIPGATYEPRIYYTGGLYYGLGAAVRGIPQEDIRGDVEFLSVENAAGQEEFSVTNEDRGLRFRGSGSASLSYDPTTHTIDIYAGSGTVYNTYNTYPTYTTVQNFYSYPTYNTYNTTVSAGAGLYANLSGSTWNIGIADGGVTTGMIKDSNVSLSKLKIGYLDLDLPPHIGIGVPVTSFFPTFWGGRGGILYALSDFGTEAQNPVGANIWLIHNYTSEWRYLRIHGISNSPFWFFILYSPENGQINAVVKGDISMDNVISPGSVFYDIQNNPQREEILQSPENFIFDLQIGEVRKLGS